jgi:hypothetical protein
MTYLLRILLMSAATLFCFGLSPISASTAEKLVLVGGTIVDVSNFGKSESDIKDSIIVIHHGKITAAGPKGKIKIPVSARVLNISGKYVIPGLSDAFATQNNQAHANAYLYMGVTSIIGINLGLRRNGPCGPCGIDRGPAESRKETDR